jgi:ABC-type multidrug transport system ATPase subunit
VAENVRFAVRAARADAGRIDGACLRLGLTGRLLKTSAAKLSAGQRRRVALAVLVARWPDLWLLDEPHAGLDASTRSTLNDLIAEASAAGTTVVLASHESEVVQSLADRVVTITGGRVTNDRSTGARPAPPCTEVEAPTLERPSTKPVTHVA